MSSPTSLEKLERWFEAPLEALRKLPSGDGAFVALSMGCQLCERFFRAKTNTQEVQDGLPFQDEAGKSLAVGEEEFKRFWKAFRHGMQHQGSPKTFTSGGRNYKWRISSQYGALPTEETVDATTTVICIDPWKFADLMISKFKNDPAILDQAMSHAFGDIA